MPDDRKTGRRRAPVPPSIPRLEKPHYDQPVADPSDLRSICEFILRQMVMQPDDLTLRWGQRDTVLELTVTPSPGTSPRQLGPLIGKEGSTIASLRRVLQVISLRYGYCVHVTIHDRMLPSPQEKA